MSQDKVFVPSQPWILHLVFQLEGAHLINLRPRGKDTQPKNPTFIVIFSRQLWSGKVGLGEEQSSKGAWSSTPEVPGHTGSGIWAQYTTENPLTVLSFGHRESLPPFNPHAYENL